MRADARAAFVTMHVIERDHELAQRAAVRARAELLELNAQE
jgi:hypothetical protein